MAVDEWAGAHEIEVVGQIGPASYVPKNFRYKAFFDAEQLDELVATAQLIISHAGMGTIITALTNAKPLVIVPRRDHLGEHRNDHQMATAQKFMGQPSIKVILDVCNLGGAISELLQTGPGPRIAEFAPDTMISNLREMVASKAHRN